LVGLATTLWELNRPEEALAHYLELLRLNPGDNHGIRYLLLDLLFELGRVDGIETLLKDYPDDWSADWSYSEALLAFRKFGDSRQAKKALKHALEVNRHVVDYLTGKKRIPSVEPPYITMGGEDEAIQYASQHLNYWLKTPGAVAWLAEAG
jgi:tetratricopeptide (TPR) repeat protein